MHHAEQVLTNHPRAGMIPLDQLTACLAACHDGATSCRACADACLSEGKLQKLTLCVQTNLDCAAVCEATAILLARGTTSDPELLRDQLQACETACAAAATECERHAGAMAHCRACAEACRRCEQTCIDLATGLMAPA